MLNDPQAATTKLPHLTVGLAHADYPGGSPRAGNNGIVTWPHDGNYYQFWTDGTDDGKFTIPTFGRENIRSMRSPMVYSREFAQTDISVEAGKMLDLNKLEWKPIRYGKQIWEIGFSGSHRRQIL